MRARLKNPRLCDILIPKDYGFGSHRVPLENGFLEAFLRPNVEVVSVRNNPIERVTPNGLQLRDGTEHEFDVLVFATGFDAGTGALKRIGGVGAYRQKCDEAAAKNYEGFAMC